MKRLLYAMHVDWAWIKQRPHFLAEQLASSISVRVAYLRQNRRAHAVANARDDRLAYSPIFQIPGRLARLSLLRTVDHAARRLQLEAAAALSRCDAVWLTSPVLYPPLARTVASRPLVYDCMDDCLGFDSPVSRQDLEEKERALLSRADLVLVSSARLAEVVRSRGYRGKPVLVNNALPETLLGNPLPARQRAADEPFTLLYMGTVSSWFDFDAVTSVLDAIPALRVELVGPAEVPVPRHSRLLHAGPVPHAQLRERVASADAFIMPFVVNDLVRAVDPVKVYEYLAFGRDVIVPDYAEMRKFARFVHTYSATQDLVSAVRRIMQAGAPTYSPDEVQAFLARHTWTVRAKQVVTELNALID